MAYTTICLCLFQCCALSPHSIALHFYFAFLSIRIVRIRTDHHQNDLPKNCCTHCEHLSLFFLKANACVCVCTRVSTPFRQRPLICVVAFAYISLFAHFQSFSFPIFSLNIFSTSSSSSFRRNRHEKKIV